MVRSVKKVVHMMKTCLVLGIACLLMTNIADGSSAGKGRILQGETVYDIMKYGAKADKTTDDAMALVQAWRAGCDAPGPSRVLVPAGKDFMMGEVVMQGPCKAPIVLDIQGTLHANPEPSSYSNMMWILVEYVKDIKILGGGTIHAHGDNVWKYASETNRMPVSFTFQSSHFGEISNLNIVDGMGFNSKIIDSSNVKVTNLKITSPDLSPNTDGIHFSNATFIEATDLDIGVGDDCISIGTGSMHMYFARLKCGPGHGLSVGSLGKRQGELPVGNITFVNCTLTKTTNGARIKSYHASPELTAIGIYYDDLIMNEVKNPILIDQHYDSKNKPQQSNVKISDVRFKNIKGTTISEVPILLNCSSKYPCEKIEVTDVDLKPVPPAENSTAACVSVATIKWGGTVFPTPPAACTK